MQNPLLALEAIREFTTRDEIEKVKLKDPNNRVKYFYKNTLKFDGPIIIRGTKKQLLPYKNLISFEEEEYLGIQEFIQSITQIESSLRLENINNLSELEIFYLNDKYIILKKVGIDKFFAISTETSTENPVFEKWSKLLRIPYTYSKKNPAFLNNMNFSYWKDNLNDVKSIMNSIDIIYINDPIQILFEDKDQTIQAHLILNILQSEIIKMEDGRMEAVSSKIEDRIPLLGCIIPCIIHNIENLFPDNKVEIQEYSLGYLGDNMGRHYIKLIINQFIEYETESYKPSIIIDVDFIGKNKDFGNINILFGLTCVENHQNIIFNFDERIRDSLGEFILEEYTKDKVSLEMRFNQILLNKGLSFSIEELQNELLNEEGRILTKTIEYYLKSINIFKLGLSDLNTSLGNSDSDIFISIAYDIFHKIKFPKDIFKYFMIEYLVGEEDIQEQIFKVFKDMLDFILLLSKAYPSKIRIEIERKVFYLVKGITDILIHHKKNQSFVYEKFKKQINSDLF
jgi:hypothetical protein